MKLSEFLAEVDQSKGLMGNHSKSATKKPKILFAAGNNNTPILQNHCYNRCLPIMPKGHSQTICLCCV